jgi:deoxyribodipyrimidine photo-lyase
VGEARLGVKRPGEEQPVIYWFRQDLRLKDLPGLVAAAATGRPLIACYVHDMQTPGTWAAGAASRWWLHHSLQALALDLAALGGRLHLMTGSALSVLPALAAQTGASAIFCSRGYQPWEGVLEAGLHECCAERGVAFKRYPGALLFEPQQVATGDGNPYKVFTPFWKACRRLPEPIEPIPVPAGMEFFAGLEPTLDLQELQLTPVAPDWAAGWRDLWQPGAAGAREALGRFLAEAVGDYTEGRNHPALQATSRLSAHLHFGELSPRELWHRARYAQAQHPPLADQLDKFLSELGWREFSHHLLFHFPHLPEQPFKAGFSRFPWVVQDAALGAWQRGETGYPIVDAGMRELWQTGFMHNRVRMIVASFLTKHLLIDWRVGQSWFWDTLVDADLANNACGWQWVAGSGADAAPYFRIFNPTLQGQKFDSQGDYVRRWVPEIAALPNKYLHQPHSAPEDVLAGAGVVLGETYPTPLVDHRYARERALAAYGSIK